VKSLAIARLLVILLMGMALAPPSAAQGPTPRRHGFWATFGIGYGNLMVRSDQERASEDPTLAFTMVAGLSPTPWLRLGVELAGWGIESYNLHDPSKGIGVSQAALAAEIYPSATSGWFIRGSFGLAIYTNMHPGESRSSGWGASAGLGHDIQLCRSLSLTPMIRYGAGTLGGVDNLLQTITHRRYRVYEMTLAITYH
jgi:hypothetical protein